jgi:hypothetical protein
VVLQWRELEAGGGVASTSLLIKLGFGFPDRDSMVGVLPPSGCCGHGALVLVFADLRSRKMHAMLSKIGRAACSYSTSDLVLSPLIFVSL